MLDVVIIGAGAAGLGAARTAMTKGLSFKVLEAALFIGGRARTDTTSLGVPYDLGCRSLYGGSENPFHALALKSGFRLGPTVENVVFHNGTGFLDNCQNKTLLQEFERLELALAKTHLNAINTECAPDSSQADITTSHQSIADYFGQSKTPSMMTADSVSIADRGFAVIPTAGEEVLDGYGALISHVAADVPVTVDCPVSEIHLCAGKLKLDMSNGQLETRTVIVTASTAVLAAGRIKLSPGGWPEEKIKAFDAVPTGSVTKIGFHLSPGVLSTNLTQISQGDTVVPTYVQCLMNEPENINWILGIGGGNLATAYVGGQFSRDLALAGKAAQIDWATQHLCKLLGSSIKRAILGTCATPFDREPWIDGGNSYCRLGTGNQRPALAEPIENRVFFAGEACSPDSPGTAHGAWETGISAIECIADLEVQ